MSAVESYYGWAGLSSHTSDTNATEFQIRMALMRRRTATLVKVVSVSGGGVGPAPIVSVQPLVNAVDGSGKSTAHGVISGIPALRTQGGGNAIINDPRVGDIGLLAVSDRDISALKANKGKQSNPGSKSIGNLADGIYVGAMINPGNPNQYIQFTDTGIRIVDMNGNSIEMTSGMVSVNPGSGFLYLGGNGSDGTYGFVQTDSGLSANVKAKV